MVLKMSSTHDGRIPYEDFEAFFEVIGLGLVGYQVIKNQIIEEIGRNMYCIYIESLLLCV